MTLGIVEGALIAGLVGAAVQDWQTGKIPNVLTGPMLLVGIALSGLFGQGWLFALAGAGLGFAVHFPLWVLQVEKGGDAKLMIAAGAFLGWQGVLELTLATLILYVPMGLAILVARGRLKNFGAHLKHLVNQAMNVPGPEPEEVTIAVMGPLILVAGLVVLATDLFDLVALMGL